MTNKIKPENIMACFHCFAKKELAIVPYKYEGRLVAYVFSCKKCHPEIASKEMRIILEPKEMDN